MTVLTDGRPHITAKDMRWGVALSLRPMARIVSLADEHISDYLEPVPYTPLTLPTNRTA